MDERHFRWIRVGGVSLGVIGGTIGTSSWIFGAAGELARAGRTEEVCFVSVCAVGVLLTGAVPGMIRLAGRRLKLIVVVETLLGSSLVFGVAALWLMQQREVVALAVNSSGRYSPAFAYAAPVAILIIMVIIGCTPIRKRLQGVIL